MRPAAMLPMPAPFVVTLASRCVSGPKNCARLVRVTARTAVGGWGISVLWVIAGCLGLFGAETRAAKADTNSAPARSEAVPFRRALTADEAAQVGQFAAALFRGGSPSDDLLPAVFARTPGTVYVAARASGSRLGHAWSQSILGAEALHAAMQGLATNLDLARRSRVTTLELDLCHSPAITHPQRDRDRLSNDQRGLVALELLTGDKAYRSAPTELIALNLDLKKAVERLAQRASIPVDRVGDAGSMLRIFAADQVLVELTTPEPVPTLMFRGNTLVRIEDVTRSAVEALGRAQATWLWTNLQTNGRLVYLYWPSRGAESPDNNAIRQWMATLTLGQMARASGDPVRQSRADQNLRYTLARFYEQDAQGHGLIVEDDAEVKLGALALAGLALVDSPQRLTYSRQELALRKTIEALWETNGAFRTFWRPADRTDNVNFYPGEALLLWATLYQESRDVALRERILTSLRYYRSWHRAQRNPAFVPWHTRAAALLWDVAPSDELRDWIFEMNDWLLGVQQWEGQEAFPDTLGRFYDPARPFGPPHASSTGVYTEGLAEAWRLARETGDAARQERYRRGLIRALRSLTQETFLDDVDLYYVTRRDVVRGGVRSTVYDNAIRVDNVQHSLAAILRILELLPAADFRP